MTFSIVIVKTMFPGDGFLCSQAPDFYTVLKTPLARPSRSGDFLGSPLLIPLSIDKLFENQIKKPDKPFNGSSVFYSADSSSAISLACFFSMIDPKKIPSSKSSIMGTDSRTCDTTSGGVINAATVTTMSSTYFRFFFK